jgi:hypothetical protein
LKKDDELKTTNDSIIDRAENAGTFILVRSLRVVSALIVLECTLFTSYITFLIRASLINDISQEIALIMSVMTIFVGSAET